MTSQTQAVPSAAAPRGTSPRTALGRALAPYLVRPADRDRARAVAAFPATRGASPAVLPLPRDAQPR